MFYPEETGHEDLVLNAISHKIPDDCSCVVAVEVEVGSGEYVTTRYLDFNKEQAICAYDDIVNLKSMIYDIQVYANPQFTSDDEYKEPSPAGLSTLCARLEMDRMIDINISTVLRKLPFVKKLPPSLINRPESHIIDLMWCLNELIPIETQNSFINELLKNFKRNIRFMNSKYSFLPMEDLSHTIDLPTCVCKFNDKEITPVYVPDMFDADYDPRVRYYSVWELLDAINACNDIDY